MYVMFVAYLHRSTTMISVLQAVSPTYGTILQSYTKYQGDKHKNNYDKLFKEEAKKHTTWVGN